MCVCVCVCVCVFVFVCVKYVSTYMVIIFIGTNHSVMLLECNK